MYSPWRSLHRSIRLFHCRKSASVSWFRTSLASLPHFRILSPSAQILAWKIKKNCVNVSSLLMCQRKCSFLIPFAQE
ncbi:hypothetical protein NQ318_004447 [Aromia moschata]|uniref:Uncharacterized protein n=1 Tax=Aromia moschata TaxID=1265417 RepID=A0AAV8XEB5_9CUCU|nr:hypothetical protein NQ318_004447 [Aromia moschata]